TSNRRRRISSSECDRQHPGDRLDRARRVGAGSRAGFSHVAGLATGRGRSPAGTPRAGGTAAKPPSGRAGRVRPLAARSPCDDQRPPSDRGSTDACPPYSVARAGDAITHPGIVEIGASSGSRTKSDSGIVVIFDNRIGTRRSGRILLKALPNCPVKVI